MLEHFRSQPLFISVIVALLLTACQSKQKPADPLPEQYRKGGAYTKALPYFNPDSCVMLIRRDVPPQWQGAAYENLILNGPEDSPLELGFKHFDFYEKNFPADTARAFAQYWRGRLLTALGKFDSAQTCLQESYDLNIRHKNYLRAGDSQEAVGHIFYHKGQTVEAIRAYLAVYEAVKNLDSTQTERKYAAMTNLVNTYYQSNHPKEALLWSQRSLPLVADETKTHLRAKKVDFYNRVSTVYVGLGLADSAIIAAKKAIELQEKYQTPNHRPNLLKSLGAAYLKKGDFKTALRYLTESDRALGGTRPARQFDLSAKLAETFFGLGRLDSAALLYKTVLQSPSPFDVSNAHTQLSEIYARQGQFKNALDALHASLDLRKKMYDVEKMQQTGAAKAELELERAEHRANELRSQQQIAQDKYIIAGLALISLLIASVALFLRQRSRSRNLSQEKQLLEKDKILLVQEKQLAEAYTKIKEQELERSEAALKNTRVKLDHSNQLLQFKNQLIEELQLRLSDRQLSPDDDAAIPGSAEKALTLRSMKILTDADWNKFRARFDQAFPGFQSKLMACFPGLSAAETRLFLLLKLKFTNKEASETLGISQESVYRSRHRLGKKLGLPDSTNLDVFIQQFS